MIVDVILGNLYIYESFDSITTQLNLYKLFSVVFQLNRVLSEMEGIYSTGKVCGIPGHDCMSLEPGENVYPPYTDQVRMFVHHLPTR